ncbi:MAG: glycosyltransferase family 2 protein [Gemmatimonadota bacterium]|nr:MAG: glycosyltransferase family 2 protein [Gemmatimonadota bacterium]
MVSVVIPVFDERDNLAPLLDEIEATLGGADHEVVAVDDCSADGSLEELLRLQSTHPQLRVITLEQRAGQSAAIVAGFELAHGEVVVTLDADGQNDPADVPRLLNLLRQNPGCAAVVGYRASRADSGWKRLQSRIANTIRNWVTGDAVRDTGCSLKAMRRAVLLDLPRFDGMHRFLPSLLRMQGGVVMEVPVAHRRRLSGKSKYGMWNRAARALGDALGVRWLIRRRLAYKVIERSER